MQSKSTYDAARLIASTVEKHFAQHVDEAIAKGEKNVTPAPSAAIIESIIDIAFWASLRREEGYSPKISLALMPPEQTEEPLVFRENFPLTPSVLTKLSPGVERPGIHLGVWHKNNQLYVWGATRSIKSLCLVLDVSEPGLLVIKHRRISGFGKFVNIAVLKGDQVKIIDESRINIPDCPTLLSSLLGFTSPVAWNDSVNVLVQLAVSMRAHKHGGSLLVVPNGNNNWMQSIVHPVTYAVEPAFSGLAKLIHNITDNNTQWQNSLRREVDALAGLTAVDGAAIINDKYELMAFGAKIARAHEAVPIEKIAVVEPVLGSNTQIIHPAQYGGTRHFSAAQFVHDQKDAIALVASQDGKFSIFSWVPTDDIVRAHRIESLLL